MKLPFFHFSAATRFPLKPLVDRENCVKLWKRLRKTFDQVLAAALMPDHLHLAVAYASAEELREVMCRVLRGYTQSIGVTGSLWQPIDTPSPLPNAKHLRRTIRYILLNPCRDRLASDPVEWEWSTYRDVLGAARPNWVDHAALERIFGGSNREFVSAFHDYVSSDPDVCVTGTPLPRVLPVNEIVSSLSGIERAVLEATRAPGDSLHRPTAERKLMVHAARELGAASPGRLAEWLGVTPRALQHLLKKEVTPAEVSQLGAAYRLLSDRERYVPHPWTSHFRKK